MVTKNPSPYVEFLNYLSEIATPQQILAFKISSQLQKRANELTAKSHAGTLTDSESFELEDLLEFNGYITYLKVKARNSEKQR